jgi:hypothetical protein
MKTNKIILATIISISLTGIACKKHTINKENGNTAAAKFSDIKAPQTFKWSTLNTVTVNYAPIANDARISTLRILDAEGHIYFQKLQKANQAFEAAIEVPGHIQQLEMRYAGVKKPIAVTNGKATISLK